MLDALIIGGGAAGLSAALILGRFRRRVVLIDSQKPANRFSHASHGFLTRDGTSPADIGAIGREQLQKYDTLTLQTGIVTHIQQQAQHFTATLDDGSQHTARKLLLATGIKDTLPDIAGLQQFWGMTVLHCPYCDGWEQRDKPVAILNQGEGALHIAQLLRVLTADVVITSNGPSGLTPEQCTALTKHGIGLIETPIARVEGHDTQVERIVFTDGSVLPRAAIFTRLTMTQHSDIAVRLGCAMTPAGLVKVDEQGRTSIAGVYAAGDMGSIPRQVIFAASQGTAAAISLNKELIAEDLAV